MLKVLFFLECDECRMPNSFITASNEIDTELWLHWMADMPSVAERFSGWHVSDEVHLCPLCFDVLKAHGSSEFEEY